MTRLIVTADDVGLHPGMTAGAVEAHRHGVVTACSMVANGAAFEHAVEHLRDSPGLAVGVHLTLVEERPLSHAVPTLVGANGLLHRSYAAFVPRYAAGLIRIGEIERELRMQIERILGAGFEVRHVNCHQHLHLLPRVFALVEHMAEEYRIPYIRIVDEKTHHVSPRGASVAALSALGRRARARSRVATNDRTAGVFGAGRIGSADDLIALLDQVEGTTELVCHPGVGEDDLGRGFAWRYRWEAETFALCDRRFRDAIEARGIELVAP